MVNWAAIGATALPNVGGWAGSVVTRKNINPWYHSLRRPSWSPPTWAFAPVWTGLYSSIGYASYMVYRDGGGFNGPAKLPLIVFGSNLALNWMWPPIFFGTHNLKLALDEIHLVSATAVGTGFLFYKINNVAGLMFIPYILWLGLATALTYRIYKDNPNPAVEEGTPKIEEVKKS